MKAKVRVQKDIRNQKWMILKKQQKTKEKIVNFEKKVIQVP